MKYIKVKIGEEWITTPVMDLTYNGEIVEDLEIVAKTNLPEAYFNQKGEKVIIKDMPDAYLLNSYAKQRQRKKEVEGKTAPEQMGNVMGHLASLDAIIEALREEAQTRGLF